MGLQHNFEIVSNLVTVIMEATIPEINFCLGGGFLGLSQKREKFRLGGGEGGEKKGQLAVLHKKRTEH